MSLITLEYSLCSELKEESRLEILDVCNRAFEQPFDSLFDLIPPESVHVMARCDRRLMSHAVITQRHFTVGGELLLKAAYVDAVATLPEAQGRGLASLVMRRVLEVSASGHEIAGLSTGRPGFYARLGWEPWLGPLALVCEDGLQPTPHEKGVMVHLFPHTPRLDMRQSLWAEWRPGGGW